MAGKYAKIVCLMANLLVPVILASCTAQPEPGEFPTLPARFADEGPAEPLVALEAFRDETNFFIRYQVGNEFL